MSLNDFTSEFIVRRIIRLFPLYLILFGVTAILQCVEFKNEVDPFYYFFFSSLMLQSMGFDAGAAHIFADTTIGIAWSVSCEFWVGILLFPIVFFLRQYKTILAIFFMIIACLTMAFIIQYSPNFMNANFQKISALLTVGTARCIVGLSLGVTAFIFYEKIKDVGLVFGVAAIECISILLCIFLYAHYSYDRHNEFVAPFLFAVIIITFALQCGPISCFFSIKAFSPIRPLSYSIYLIHPLFILLFRKFSIPFTSFDALLYVVLIVFSAGVCYRLIEQP